MEFAHSLDDPRFLLWHEEQDSVDGRRHLCAVLLCHEGDMGGGFLTGQERSRLEEGN